MITIPPFTVVVQVAVFFVGICLVHTVTAHVPIPTCIDDSLGRFFSMILGPIGSGAASFNSIFLFSVKMGRGNWFCRRNWSSLHDAISAGAVVIRIPVRFTPVLNESPFDWRRVKDCVPKIDGNTFHQHSPSRENPNDETVLCSLPANSRLTTNSVKPFPSSNKLNTVFAILQLVYSAAQAYIQYEPMIRNQGLSSPFIIAIPYLYMNFINLIANLVQGSYMHITIIPPTVTEITNSLNSSTENLTAEGDNSNESPRETEMTPESSPSLALPAQIPSENEVARLSRELEESPVEHPGSQTDINQTQRQSPPMEDPRKEFERWLQTHYPQIEFEESPSLSSIAFFMHYSISLATILVWIGLLTGFKTGYSPSQPLLLLAVIIDPILHLLLATAQAWEGCPQGILMGLGANFTIKLLAWGFNLIGCISAAIILGGIYAGTSN